MTIFHPFFLSLTEIRYNKDSQKLEISQKIFWDDLEIGMGNYTGENVNFLNPKDPAKLKSQLQEYLQLHNQVVVNGKNLTLRLLGYEVEDDAAWFFLESSSSEVPKSVEVKNTVLLKDIEGQRNIVHVYNQTNSPRSLLLGKGEESGTIEF
ncbi:hypothetical protein GCM10009119_07180 [Algoriphagus jejuensis]|uniref:Uncharacterized protein n=2 Tax=Algoriphagus jejuensis TaxID=419934 RepID=A0ABN1MX44_9BACT